MRWKMFALITGLVLMVTISVPPSKVVAQGLVEYAIILVVIPVGTKEAGEVYWYLPHPSRDQSQGGDVIKVAFLYKPARVSPLDSSSDGPCTETVQSTVKAYPGFNTLNVKMGEGNESLLINGEVVELSESCLMGADRVAIQVGVPIPPSMVERFAADPTTVPAGLPDIVGYTIVGQDGRTVAAGSDLLRSKGGGLGTLN